MDQLCLLNLIQQIFLPQSTLIILLVSNFQDIPQLENPILIAKEPFEISSTHTGNYIIFLDDSKGSNESRKSINELPDTFNESLDTLNELLDTLNKTLKTFKKSKLFNECETPRSKFLLSLENTPIGIPNEIIPKIFLLFWSYDITNVIILTGGEIIFSSPFSPENNCGQSAVIKKYSCEFLMTESKEWEMKPESKHSKMKNELKELEDWQESFESPNKKKFPRCDLKVTMISDIISYPFIGNISSKKPGLFVAPLQLAAGKLLFNLSIAPAPIDQQLKYLLNGSALYDDVLNKKTDTYIANSWRNTLQYENLEPSDIFLYDKHVWIVPKPPRLSGLQVMLYAFSWEVWMGIFLVLALVLFSWFIIIKSNPHEDNVTSLSLVGIALWVSAPSLPERTPLRVVFVFWTIFSIHMGCCYQGKLFGSMTKPGFERGVKNFEELLQSDLVPLLVSTNADTLRQSGGLGAKIAQKSQKLTLIGGVRTAYVAKYRNVSVPLYGAYLEMNLDLKDEIEELGEKFLFSLEGTYSFRRGSPYLPAFNYMFKWQLESGFPVKWRRDIKERKFSPGGGGPEVLTLRNLQGPFIVLLVGYGVGFFLFGFEVLCGVFRCFPRFH